MLDIISKCVSVERLIFNRRRTPSSGLLPSSSSIFLPWFFLGVSWGIVNYSSCSWVLEDDVEQPNQSLLWSLSTSYLSILAAAPWCLAHVLFAVKTVSSYIRQTVKLYWPAMGRPVSLLYFFVRGIYYLLDKLVPLTVENDCQAFDFHYGAKKGQRRCEVGVKAFSVQKKKCVFKDWFRRNQTNFEKPQIFSLKDILTVLVISWGIFSSQFYETSYI